jgi:hypothetical protein
MWRALPDQNEKPLLPFRWAWLSHLYLNPLSPHPTPSPLFDFVLTQWDVHLFGFLFHYDTIPCYQAYPHRPLFSPKIHLGKPINRSHTKPKFALAKWFKNSQQLCFWSYFTHAPETELCWLAVCLKEAHSLWTDPVVPEPACPPKIS